MCDRESTMRFRTGASATAGVAPGLNGAREGRPAGDRGGAEPAQRVRRRALARRRAVARLGYRTGSHRASVLAPSPFFLGHGRHGGRDGYAGGTVR